MSSERSEQRPHRDNVDPVVTKEPTQDTKGIKSLHSSPQRTSPSSLPDVARCTLLEDRTREQSPSPSTAGTEESAHSSKDHNANAERRKSSVDQQDVANHSKRTDKTSTRHRSAQQNNGNKSQQHKTSVVSPSSAWSGPPQHFLSAAQVNHVSPLFIAGATSVPPNPLFEMMLPTSITSITTATLNNGSSSPTAHHRGPSSNTPGALTPLVAALSTTPNTTYPSNSLMASFLSPATAMLGTGFWHSPTPGAGTNTPFPATFKSVANSWDYSLMNYPASLMNSSVTNGFSAAPTTGTVTSTTGNSYGHSTGPSFKHLPDRTSSTNLYIKGLAAEFTDDKLKSLVPDPNLVKSVKAASDDGTSCKGYGFIDFITAEAALAAQKHIQHHHSSFTVKFAKENEKDTTNLYITNLPLSWKGKKDEDRLKEEFSKYGVIQSVHIQTDPTTNRSTGVGFVRFTTEEGAKKALEDLRENARCLDTATSPLQAKFADKHSAARARRMTQQAAAANGGFLGGSGGIGGVGIGSKNRALNSLARPELLLSTPISSPLSPYPSLFLRAAPLTYPASNVAASGYPAPLVPGSNGTATAQPATPSPYSALSTLTPFLQAPFLSDNAAIPLSAIPNLYTAFTLQQQQATQQSQQHQQQQFQQQQQQQSAANSANPQLLNTVLATNPSSSLAASFHYLSNGLVPQYFPYDYSHYYNHAVTEQ